MTKEELRKHCEWTCDRYRGAHIKGLSTAYEEHKLILDLLNQTEWIPVSERLPEEHTRVLVCDRTSVYMANLNDGWWYFSPAEIGMIVKQSDISAWMPLPEPWKGDEECP